MTFSESLAQRRKSLGLSQEDLAAKVQVSRQAVSKWETGDAMPDLVKLLALADALDISLDALCGRAAPPPPAANTPSPPAATAENPLGIVRSGRARWLWLALCVLLAVCLAAGGIWWNWSQRNMVPSEEAVSVLPDLITVSGVSFYGREDSLTYQFVPSVTGDAYTYRITFTDSAGDSRVFDAPCTGGVCAGTVPLAPSSTFLVAVTVEDGAGNSRSVVVADTLTFSGGSASWTPAA